MTNQLKIGFIGAGTVGTALAVRLSRRGYPVIAVSSRSYKSAQRLAEMVPGCEVSSSQGVADKAKLIFITTPDDAIPLVAAQVKWHQGQSVVHCSGVDSTDILEPAANCGAQVGGIHPLQTFAGIQQAIDNIPGSTFALEAVEPLLAVLQEITIALESRWVVLQAQDKIAYHTAAVMTSNYLVTLLKLATDLWESFGIPREQAIQALLPLLKGTINNIENMGIPDCLTGPIARGDIGTVTLHLESLRKTSPELVSTYCELGLQTIPVALAKGRIERNKAQELKDMLEQYQHKSNFERNIYAYDVEK